MISLCLLIFLAWNVKATWLHKGTETNIYYLRTIPEEGNTYVRMRYVPPVDPKYETYIRPKPLGYLDILQDITPDLGLKLSVQLSTFRWSESGESELVILEDDGYQDLCSALANETLQTRPNYPNPLTILGLQDQRCPIKKGTLEWNWYDLPSTIEIEFELSCATDVMMFEVRIDGTDSTVENQDTYLHAILVGSCDHSSSN